MVVSFHHNQWLQLLLFGTCFSFALCEDCKIGSILQEGSTEGLTKFESQEWRFSEVSGYSIKGLPHSPPSVFEIDCSVPSKDKGSSFVFDVIVISECVVSVSYEAEITVVQKDDAGKESHIHTLQIPHVSANDFLMDVTPAKDSISLFRFYTFEKSEKKKISISNVSEQPCDVSYIDIFFRSADEPAIASLVSLEEMKKTAVIFQAPEDLRQESQKAFSDLWKGNFLTTDVIKYTEEKGKFLYEIATDAHETRIMYHDVSVSHVPKQDIVQMKSLVHILNAKSVKEQASVTSALAVISGQEKEKKFHFFSASTFVNLYYPVFHHEQDNNEIRFLASRVSGLMHKSANSVRIGAIFHGADTEESENTLYRIKRISLGRYGEPEKRTVIVEDKVPGWGIALLVIFSFGIVVIICVSLFLFFWYKKTQIQQFRVMQAGDLDAHEDLGPMVGTADLELEMVDHS